MSAAATYSPPLPLPFEPLPPPVVRLHRRLRAEVRRAEPGDVVAVFRELREIEGWKEIHPKVETMTRWFLVSERTIQTWINEKLVGIIRAIRRWRHKANEYVLIEPVENTETCTSRLAEPAPLEPPGPYSPNPDFKNSNCLGVVERQQATTVREAPRALPTKAKATENPPGGFYFEEIPEGDPDYGRYCTYRDDLSRRAESKGNPAGYIAAAAWRDWPERWRSRDGRRAIDVGFTAVDPGKTSWLKRAVEQARDAVDELRDQVLSRVRLVRGEKA